MLEPPRLSSISFLPGSEAGTLELEGDERVEENQYAEEAEKAERQKEPGPRNMDD